MKPEHDAEQLLRALTDREREILALIGRGHSMPEIARMLGRSVRTVQAHRYSLGRKLKAKSSLSLARLAIELGLAPIDSTAEAHGQQRQSRAEEALSVIEAGISAMTDDNFLDRLVRLLAGALEVRCGMVAEIIPGDPTEVKVLAGWHAGEAIPRLRCPLAHCPFAEPPQDRMQRVPTGLAEAYPRCHFVRDNGLDAYLGTCLRSSDGRKIATLAIMNDGPINPDLYPELILRIFAGRAAAELERRRARQALRLSEARYQGVVEDSSDPVCRFTHDLHLTFVNRALGELLDTPPGSLVGQRLLQFIPLPEQPILRRVLDRLGPQERSTTVTIGLENDGERRHHWNVQALFNGDGNIVEYQAILQPHD
jgi:DNA-binding CsgD family transcriptional regulator